GLPVLGLEPTPDVLAELGRIKVAQVVVGFAAETDNVEGYARGKLEKKKLDLIAANRVGIAGSGFESDDNALTIYWAGGARSLGPAPKSELADRLLDLIAERLSPCTTSSN
ncbi:MAG: phosphopantothenoylcysteine decarboxylase, partial [Lysobacter sp.]